MRKNMTRHIAKFLGFAAAAIAMTACLAACTDDGDYNGSATPPPYQGPTVKTLLMYFPWSTDLTSYFHNNIADMERAVVEAKADSVRVLVYICTSSAKAELFEMVRSGQTCDRVRLKEYQDPAYTTAEGIASMLCDVKALAPAKSYAMTIGCHGTGWLPVYTSRGRSGFPPQKFHWEAAGALPTRYFGGLASQYQTDIATLAKGIEDADIHFNFILFDDCYMSSVEAAYDLRHTTDWLIACPTEIMAYGMPYAKIGASLISTTTDFEELCSNFVSFYSSYTYPYGTIAATRTAGLDSLARVMGKMEANHTLDPSLRPYIQSMDGYTPTIFYDLGDYAAALCADQALLAEFEAQMRRTVPYKGHTQQYYSAFTGPMPIRAYSGLTTSAPTTSRYADDWAETEWYKATRQP